MKTKFNKNHLRHNYLHQLKLIILNKSLRKLLKILKKNKVSIPKVIWVLITIELIKFHIKTTMQIKFNLKLITKLWWEIRMKIYLDKHWPLNILDKPSQQLLSKIKNLIIFDIKLKKNWKLSSNIIKIIKI